MVGLFLFVQMVLIFASDGKLLRGSGWAHSLVICAAVWIVAYFLSIFLDIRNPRAAQRRTQSSTVGTPNTVRTLAVISVCAFLIAVLLMASSYHRHEVQIWCLLGAGSILLILANSAVRNQSSRDT